MALAVCAADQIARGDSLVAEWWFDLPLAALVAALALRAAGRGDDLRSSDRRPGEGLEEVVLAVSRGRHVHEVLESLTRQACQIMRVERAVVVLRDESDPRSAVVVAGHGVPRDYVGRRIGIDEGMAGHVITTGDPVLVDDYADFPRRIGHPAGAGLRAGAAAPIGREGSSGRQASIINPPPGFSSNDQCPVKGSPNVPSSFRFWKRKCQNPSTAS